MQIFGTSRQSFIRVRGDAAMTINRFAGMGGHQSARSETDTWISPPAIIEALGGVDSFDLDPCAAEGQPWPTARHHFTVVDNGLLQRWFGRVWLNPPYSIKLATRFLGVWPATIRASP